MSMETMGATKKCAHKCANERPPMISGCKYFDQLEQFLKSLLVKFFTFKKNVHIFFVAASNQLSFLKYTLKSLILSLNNIIS